ncbi:acidic leucine-rich nuclear phosphoprotein 32-related protein 2-like [Malania oleifera]|uniref:acidic leucine-rich nuclear phosphoprotein 32-related protein 2-like n=1 Tax=Malania oleifera TaxID=397392 RepID=UPI0025AE1E75|nr:acidic leucine-rich nuclear phosphoprotein 32-related protein 2-like [Malania oleifera]
MGYDKGSSGWYLKSSRTQYVSTALASAATSGLASVLASASASVSAANIKEKVTSLDQPVTHIEKFQARSSRGGDPMDISSIPQSGDDDNDCAENEGDFEEEGNEVDTKEEGTREEEEEEGQGDGFEEEG